MRILLISDTHGATKRAFKAHTLSEPIDVIIHLGDGDGGTDADTLRDALEIPVINVAGNCDPGSRAPRELVWECEGKRLLLTHGDIYQVKSGLMRLRMRTLEIRVDAVLFGHTHQKTAEEYGGVLFVNPGSLSNHDHYNSYAVLNVTPKEITVRHFDID